MSTPDSLDLLLGGFGAVLFETLMDLVGAEKILSAVEGW